MELSDRQLMRGIVLLEKMSSQTNHSYCEIQADSDFLALVIDRALEPDLACEDEDSRRLLLRGTPRMFSQKASP